MNASKFHVSASDRDGRSVHGATIDCPAGFCASGLASGIKPSGAEDLALIHCPGGATAAGVFTKNLVCAAPVMLCREALRRSGGHARALVINSGCANAATGNEGRRRAQEVVDTFAKRLGCPPDEILTNSTGVIGELLPADCIVQASGQLIEKCRPSGLADASRAILTTDTVTKVAERTIETANRSCRVVGVAKGSGMIHPNMATMIAAVMTDAEIDPAGLQAMLHHCVDRSFHRISVDGDTSTNDAVYALASGLAGTVEASPVEQAMLEVCRDLARMIVRDGEGASSVIHVTVSGAPSQAEAFQVARTVGSSMLVRTMVAGGDPNWGRVLAAAGRSGVMFDPEAVTLEINGFPVYVDGTPARIDRTRLCETFEAEDDVSIHLDLKAGEAKDEYMTCDLTEQYIRINADYTS